jgi:hypothetical protein
MDFQKDLKSVSDEGARKVLLLVKFAAQGEADIRNKRLLSHNAVFRQLDEKLRD